MKATLAITLLAALTGQAYSDTLRLGVRNTNYRAAPDASSDTETSSIVFYGPREISAEQEEWQFQLPEENSDTEVLIQHVQTEKYIQCSLGETGCVLAENGTSFTAYKPDFENEAFMVGVDFGEGQEDWVLEAGDVLHLAEPAEEVGAQWFTFNVEDGDDDEEE
ncbi:uncharacterized protein KD926_009698 [Aspergillus affinis]|uniref:uncharacterized protein n=1 Tax=Aspergillus affinis TaxID=1070780 RepID=UPI0022FEFAAE|nr:uncharacterized protein KD926_009698 [Aspergillus affinis]KAI9045284.1 hypothetical protein KD926_009698 [Aspergillus affinis]